MLQERIDSLFSDWDTARTPGCAVGIVHRGSLVLSAAYGVRDIDAPNCRIEPLGGEPRSSVGPFLSPVLTKQVNGQPSGSHLPSAPWGEPPFAARRPGDTGAPIDENTLFDIGSEAKQFTGASVLLLENAGALHLDDDIHEYVPELPDYGARVTLHHLAHHTSGIPEYYDAMLEAGLFRSGCTMSTVLEYLVHQKHLGFSPGERFRYCNSGYVLLSTVLERVAGMGFAPFVRTHLFGPTNMDTSFVADEPPCAVPNMARGHDHCPENGYVHREYENYAVPGPGSLYSTVRDLSRWVSALQDPESGFYGLGRQMLAPATLNTGEETRYGFGLDWGQCFTPPDGLHIVTHSGMHAGFRSVILRVPESGLALILLCNTRDIDHPRMALRLLDMVLEEQAAAGEDEPGVNRMTS